MVLTSEATNFLSKPQFSQYMWGNLQVPSVISKTYLDKDFLEYHISWGACPQTPIEL